MKNSVWYYKLWRKKLDEYSLKENADTSWAKMQSMLDEHMPPGEPVINKKPGRFFGGTLISTLGFILPAAAMIGIASFVAVKHNPFKPKPLSKIHFHHKIKNVLSDDKNETDSLAADSEHHVSASAETRAEKITADNSNPDNSNATDIKTGTTIQPMARSGTLMPKAAIQKEQIKKTGKQNIASSPRSVMPDHHAKQVSQSSSPNNLYAAMPDSVKSGAGLNEPGTGSKNETSPDIPDPANKVKDQTPVAGRAKGTDQVSKISPSSKTKPQKATNTKNNNAGDARYEFGLESALNAGSAGANAVFGIWGSYRVNPKFRVNAGLRYEQNMPLSGDIVHRSFAPVDSLNTFKVTNSRKISSVSVPITLEYKVSNRVSIHAGPQIRISVNQTKITNKLGTVTNYRDTLSKSNSIDSSLRINSINKINLGISGGVSIHLNRFYIDGRIQQNITPYKISTALGNYQQNYRSFQIGVRYILKRK
jgi:hypothetical protein